MSMELTCPVCGSVNGFKEAELGSKGTCGRCGVPLYVPSREEMPSDAEVRLYAGRGGMGGKGVLIFLCLGFVAFIALAGASTGLYFFFPWKNAIAKPLIDPFASAPSVKVTAAPTTQDGTLENSGDEVVFRFKAAANGHVSVSVDPGDDGKLDGQLHAYDDKKKEIASNADEPDNRAGQIVFPVKNDAEYFVKLTGFDASAGKYKLTFQNTVSLAGDFANAHKIRLSRTGSANRVFRMERAGDENAFELTAPVAGWMFAEVGPAPGGNLDAIVKIFDDAKSPIDSESINSRTQGARFYVQKGKTYFVKVSSNAQPAPGWGRSGPYALNLRTAKTAADDFPNDFASAAKLTIDPNLATNQAGQIENDLDNDLFTFQTPKTGALRIAVNPAGLNNIEVFAIVYDSGKKAIFSNAFDFRTYNVVAGQTYYVKVYPQPLPPLPGRSRTGGYTLQISYPNVTTAMNNTDFTTAAQIKFVGDQADAKGSINDPILSSYFKFTAPKTCLMKCDVLNAPGSTLDAVVTAYNSNMTPIQALLGPSSFVDFSVTANQTYYLKVSARSFPAPGLLRTGSFTVQMNATQQFGAGDNPKKLDDLKPIGGKSDFDSARLVTIGAAGTSEVNDDIIDAPRCYSFIPGKDGLMTVSLEFPFSSKLDARVNAYDANQLSVKTTGSFTSANFPVAAGQKYYVKVLPVTPPLPGLEKTGSFKAVFRLDK